VFISLGLRAPTSDRLRREFHPGVSGRIAAIPAIFNSSVPSDDHEGSVRVKVEDGGSTAVTDTTMTASFCSVFVSVLLTPVADGTFALQWANQDGGGGVMRARSPDA